jgi:hypothetical protein
VWWWWLVVVVSVCVGRKECGGGGCLELSKCELVFGRTDGGRRRRKVHSHKEIQESLNKYDLGKGQRINKSDLLILRPFPSIQDRDRFSLELYLDCYDVYWIVD